MASTPTCSMRVSADSSADLSSGSLNRVRQLAFARAPEAAAASALSGSGGAMRRL